MRVLWISSGLALLLAVAACAEKPQTAGTRTVGESAYKGTGSPTFADPNWKAGDAKSWEEHMRTRTQSGQNEYVRSAGS